jgi:hypothetical protein
MYSDAALSSVAPAKARARRCLGLFHSYVCEMLA